MTITAIARNFDGNPNIVTIVTTDNLATITTTGYVSTQSDAIKALQNGIFEWATTDLVLMYYATAQIGFFVYDAVNDTFDAIAPTGGLANTLQNTNIFVGNASNIATGVSLSGDATISNTGVITLADDSVGFNEVTTAVSALNVVTVTASELRNMYTTPVQLIEPQGANTFIVLDEIIWDINFATTQFTGGGVIAAQYGNAAFGAGVQASSTISASTFNGIADSSFLYMGPNVAFNALKVEAENVGIYLSNATAVFAAGNSEAILSVRYHVLTSV